MKYLLTFIPLEPYTFGTDQTFDYPGSGKTGKESYFALSLEVPEQTTILGTLRYMALLQAGKLNTDFAYADTDPTEINKLIGPESFGFPKENQSFGVIKSISPLFLVDGKKNDVLVRNPFHNRAEKSGYRPMALDEAVETSAGRVRLPSKDQYDPKKGHAGGFIGLRSKEIANDLFLSRFIPGNRKAAEGESRTDGFFRREVIYLKEGVSFAVLADVEEDSLPNACIVHMGQKRSTFRAVARKVTELPMELSDVLPMQVDATPADVLKSAVEAAFCDGDTWYYALSDLIPPKDFALGTFSIVEKKGLRNLETVLSGEKQLKKLRRSEMRFHMVCAGSVFSDHMTWKPENANARQVGYNVICKLGGK